ncbi:MAG: transcriptional regulator, partial [Actinobacteria bacterium]|nr:transcriptional regulator [Actinomycetota bacterium]
MAIKYWRWLAVLAATAVLVSLPAVAADLPVSRSTMSAEDLLSRIEHSGEVPYSGYAESDGGLNLPVSGQFSSISNLFSGTTQLRVWYRGATSWRVDTVGVFGESDLHDTVDGLWTWDYESNSAVLDSSPQDVRARLPRADDLLPAPLARRVLSGVSSGSVERISDERIAGHTAVGLRLHAPQQQSTIDHVDVWALPATGLALRVTVWEHSSATPALDTSMLDVSTDRPSVDTVAFNPPPGARIRTEPAPDLVSLVDRLGRDRTP